MGFIISISGKAGSGKTTVAKILAARLGFKYYSVGELRRKMARERGMTLEEFNKLGEKEDFTDREVDEFQKKLGEKETNFVIDGRTSYHFIPSSVKIFLDADLKERARRIMNTEREEERFGSLEEAERGLIEREKSDAFRYKKYYGIDADRRENYDLVIDTTKISPEEAAEKIMEYLKERGLV